MTSHSGVRVPAILYGTAWKKERTAALVRKALERGFRGIDTACQPKHYDEAGVGEAVAACLGEQLSRHDLYLQSKFTPLPGHDPKRIPYDAAAPVAQQVAQSWQVSLRNLRTSYLDCLVLHSPLDTHEQTLEAWRAMEAIVDGGGARQIGISNCYRLERLQRLHRAARVKPAVVQNRFYAETGYDREIRAFCKQHAILYQSFWTLSANPHVLAHPAVLAIAAGRRQSPAQVLFRFLAQDGIVPLTGTRSEAHMAEDLAIFEFDLQLEERERIRAVLEGA